MASLLLSTIETDLKAGVSWFEGEAETVGLELWNVLKSAFIALEPAAGKVLLDTLTGAVTGAAAGQTIEQIEEHALSTASTEGKAALATAGSGVVQTVIASLRSNLIATIPVSPPA